MCGYFRKDIYVTVWIGKRNADGDLLCTSMYIVVHINKLKNIYSMILYFIFFKIMSFELYKPTNRRMYLSIQAYTLQKYYYMYKF